MADIIAILDEVGPRLADALGLSTDEVHYDPTEAELPEYGPYIAIRWEVTNGQRDAGAYDVATLRIFIAAEIPDPGIKRRQDRQKLIDDMRARMTPCRSGIYGEIPGWEEPYMVDSMTTSADDSPGILFLGATFEGFVTLPRGGYAG